MMMMMIAYFDDITAAPEETITLAFDFLYLHKNKCFYAP